MATSTGPGDAEALFDFCERLGVSFQHGLAPRDHARAGVTGGEGSEVAPERSDPVIVSLHRAEGS